MWTTSRVYIYDNSKNMQFKRDIYIWGDFLHSNTITYNYQPLQLLHTVFKQCVLYCVGILLTLPEQKVIHSNLHNINLLNVTPSLLLLTKGADVLNLNLTPYNKILSPYHVGFGYNHLTGLEHNFDELLNPAKQRISKAQYNSVLWLGLQHTWAGIVLSFSIFGRG